MAFHFGNRCPRGFHHTFRFTDEQREVLDKLRQGVPPEDVARQSLCGEDSRTTRRRTPGFGLSLAQSGCLATVVLILMLAFLLAVVS
jgi:hypothetical protein